MLCRNPHGVLIAGSDRAEKGPRRPPAHFFVAPPGFGSRRRGGASITGPLVPCAVSRPPLAPAVVIRPYPAASVNIAAVRVGITRTRVERTGRGAERAADYRARRGAAATTGNRTERGARPGAHQPAANIELCVGGCRRQQRRCDASGRDQ